MNRVALCLTVIAFASSCVPPGTSTPVANDPPATSAAPRAVAEHTRFVGSSADTARAPRISRLVVEVVPDDADPSLSRVRVDASHREVRIIGYEIEVESADFLRDSSIDPVIRRYVIYPSSGPPLEYVHRRDGAPLLPSAAPRDWLPRPLAADADSMTFLGRVFQRDAGDAPQGAWPLASAKRIALDPDFLVATSRDFRDDGTGRAGRDWRWVPLSADDYRAMLRAGFSLFRGNPGTFLPPAEFPAFVVASTGWAAVPDLLLRGNYLGAVMYSDEPAVHVYGRRLRASVRSPTEMAEEIALETRRTHAGQEQYGRGFLAHRIDAEDLRYGRVVQPTYPAWDAVLSAAWVELLAGAGGFCYEARLQPVQFAADVEHAVGVPFPSDPSSCIRFHLAVLRGAARRFDAPWGVSVYGQTDPAAADSLFPLAYDAGATYFWLWTSDGAHHVPWTRQLQLVRALREHADAHSRESAAARTKQARVAVALPFGYALDDFTFHADPPSVWGIPSLPLTARNDASVPHRIVLAAAMREAVDLLARGDPFDVLFLQDSEQPRGYDEVRRVASDGTVRRQRR